MRQFLSYFRKTLILIPFAALAVGASSCTKVTNADTGTDGAKFVGTWTGTTVGGVASTLTITAGGNGNALTTLSSVGSSTACAKTITLNITASGNSILIPAQIFTDNCGVSYTVTGNGSVNGNTLTFTETTLTGNVATTYNFTGIK